MKIIHTVKIYFANYAEQVSNRSILACLIKNNESDRRARGVIEQMKEQYTQRFGPYSSGHCVESDTNTEIPDFSGRTCTLGRVACETLDRYWAVKSWLVRAEFFLDTLVNDRVPDQNGELRNEIVNLGQKLYELRESLQYDDVRVVPQKNLHWQGTVYGQRGRKYCTYLSPEHFALISPTAWGVWDEMDSESNPIDGGLLGGTCNGTFHWRGTIYFTDGRKICAYRSPEHYNRQSPAAWGAWKEHQSASLPEFHQITNMGICD